MQKWERKSSPPRGECVRFKTKLGELVPAVFSAHDVDEKVNLFTAILLGILNDTIPECTVRVHPTDKPWMTPRIKKEIKARQRAYTNGYNDKYKQLCDKVSKLIEKTKESYYRDLRPKVFVSPTQRNGIEWCMD